MNKDFDGLRERLEELSFPSLYMYKFIVKAELNKIAQIESLFNVSTAEVLRKESSKGAFVSITVKEIMMSADEIIDIYMKASKIEGVIAL